MKKILFLTIFLWVSCIAANAATLTVTKIADTNDGICDADCSLREAIDVAASGDVIEFSALFNSAQTIVLSGTEFLIDKSLTINGTGANKLTLDGDFQSRVFNISGVGINVNLNDLKITRGLSTTNGGGIAILNADVVAKRLWVTDNLVQNAVATTIFGGGIDNLGTLTISNSTISGNSIMSGNLGRGGGIANGRLFTNATLTVQSSTISGNTITSTGASSGGGISNEKLMTITSSTITNNTAGAGSGTNTGFLGTSTIGNTIIAENINQDAFGNYVSNGFNLIGDGTGTTGITQPTDQVGTTAVPIDPLLGALAYNGGTTPTHSLNFSSPALDQGNNFGLTIDQRGENRPVDQPTITNAIGGDATDIGAFEVLLVSAAGATISGRVLYVSGNVTVELTDLNGGVMTTKASSFGYYSFEDVPVGQTYIINIRSRRFIFDAQVFTLLGNIENLNFMPQNQK